VGASGSGKTTALKMINRLVEPDCGQVRFESEAVESFDTPTVGEHQGGEGGKACSSDHPGNTPGDCSLKNKHWNAANNLSPCIPHDSG
jgi:ABC-type cobalamin/Fe3+-siderophores transport system ATPase subunit